MAKTILLTNRTHPELRVYCPSDREYEQFHSGRLAITEDHPHFEEVMRHARLSPDISISEVGKEPEKRAAAFPCDVCRTGYETEAAYEEHVRVKHTKTELDEAGNAPDIVVGSATTSSVAVDPARSRGRRAKGAADTGEIPAAQPSTRSSRRRG